jgi:hypothetical protein
MITLDADDDVPIFTAGAWMAGTPPDHSPGAAMTTSEGPVAAITMTVLRPRRISREPSAVLGLTVTMIRCEPALR